MRGVLRATASRRRAELITQLTAPLQPQLGQCSALIACSRQCNVTAELAGVVVSRQLQIVHAAEYSLLSVRHVESASVAQHVANERTSRNVQSVPLPHWLAVGFWIIVRTIYSVVMGKHNGKARKTSGPQKVGSALLSRSGQQVRDSDI